MPRIPLGYEIFVDQPIFQKPSWSRTRRKLCRLWISYHETGSRIDDARAKALLDFGAMLGLKSTDLIHAGPGFTFHFLITTNLRRTVLFAGGKENTMKDWINQTRKR